MGLYALVEMMGHRRLVASVSEIEMAGESWIKLEPLTADGEIPEPEEHYRLIKGHAVFCITSLTREEALKANEAMSARSWLVPALEDADVFLPSDDEDEAGGYPF